MTMTLTPDVATIVLAFDYATAEAYFYARATMVLCCDGDRQRFCISAAEAREFFHGTRVMR